MVVDLHPDVRAAYRRSLLPEGLGQLLRPRLVEAADDAGADVLHLAAVKPRFVYIEGWVRVDGALCFVPPFSSYLPVPHAQAVHAAVTAHIPPYPHIDG